MKPYFFSPEKNYDAEEFRQYLPFNVNVDFEVLASGIEDAEHKYIVPILGEQLTLQLRLYYEQDPHDDELLDRLLQRVQSAVIRIAYYENFDLLAVNITESGVQDTSGENRAYRYQVDRAKDTLARQAFEHLEYFYDAVASSGLRQWDADDPNNPRPQDSVFRDYQEFFHAISMQLDFRLFARLKSWIRNVEQTMLPYIVGSTLADAIILRESRITKPILDAAQRFVAYNALSLACPLLHALLTEDGLLTRTMKAEGQAGGYATQVADKSSRDKLSKRYAEVANSAGVELESLLRADVDKYPEIKYVSTRDNVRVRPFVKTKKSMHV